MKFDKNEVLFDLYFAYSYVDINRLFTLKNSWLLNYTYSGQSFSKWLDETCRKYNINPRLILSLLEKEHKLVTMTEPPAREKLEWIFGHGKGVLDAIPSAKHLAVKYSGFENQIVAMIQNLKRYFELGPGKIGKLMNCIDGDIVPQNAFTYTLYMIDPYIGTEDLFRKQIKEDETGKLIESEKNDYVIKKFLFIKYKKKIKVKVIENDVNLSKKAPFGVYAIWLAWCELFGI